MNKCLYDSNLLSRLRWLSWMCIRLVIRRLQVRPSQGQQHSVVEIDHEIFSTVSHSLPLIQEGQLSVSGKRMFTILVNRLEDEACPVKVWLGKLTRLYYMSSAAWNSKSDQWQYINYTSALTVYGIPKRQSTE